MTVMSPTVTSARSLVKEDMRSSSGVFPAECDLREPAIRPSSVAPPVATTTAVALAKKSSVTLAHTVAAGANRLLIVTVAHKDATKRVTGVTYNGVPLTIRISASNAANNTSSIYYLVNPPEGSASVDSGGFASVDSAMLGSSLTAAKSRLDDG